MFSCLKTTVSLIDDHPPHTYEIKSDSEWEAFVADYESRGIAGAVFQRTDDNTFIFITSNATHCQFVRTDV